VVDGDTRTIELATEHLRRDWHAENVTGELAMSVCVVDISSAFENLNTQKRMSQRANFPRS